MSFPGGKPSPSMSWQIRSSLTTAPNSCMWRTYLEKMRRKFGSNGGWHSSKSMRASLQWRMIHKQSSPKCEESSPLKIQARGQQKNKTEPTWTSEGSAAQT
ncbi:hypothetical protein [Lucky bamboo bacilliform virus]|nr:hypothetical protein [Lucky bamboo bacilliform virus]